MSLSAFSRRAAGVSPLFPNLALRPTLAIDLRKMWAMTRDADRQPRNLSTTTAYLMAIASSGIRVGISFWIGYSQHPSPLRRPCVGTLEIVRPPRVDSGFRRCLAINCSNKACGAGDSVVREIGHRINSNNQSGHASEVALDGICMENSRRLSE
jgi:hypothetical protein